jgi:hypothetical protein
MICSHRNPVLRESNVSDDCGSEISFQLLKKELSLWAKLRHFRPIDLGEDKYGEQSAWAFHALHFLVTISLKLTRFAPLGEASNVSIVPIRVWLH